MFNNDTIFFFGFEYAYLVNKMTSNERHTLEEEIAILLL